MMVLAWLLLCAAAVDDARSTLLVGRSGVVINGDVEITGKWTSNDVSGKLPGAMWGCAADTCSGHGICTFSTPPCTCQVGYCGMRCNKKADQPVTYISTVRTSATSVSLTFAAGQCSLLSTSDRLRLVKGSCGSPFVVLKDVISPTLSADGRATFSFDPTGLPAPFSTCYQLASSAQGNVFLSTAAPEILPCVTATDYTCPTTGACVASCSSCPSSYTVAYARKQMCARSVGPLGSPSCTAVMTCGGCGNWEGDTVTFWNGVTTDFAHGNANGECATWVMLPTTFVIYRLTITPRDNFWYRLKYHQIMFFSEDSPPDPLDTYATLVSKALPGSPIANYDEIPVPPVFDFGDLDVRARYVLFYRPGSASEVMNFNELEVIGVPNTGYAG